MGFSWLKKVEGWLLYHVSVYVLGALHPPRCSGPTVVPWRVGDASWPSTQPPWLWSRVILRLQTLIKVEESGSLITDKPWGGCQIMTHESMGYFRWYPHFLGGRGFVRDFWLPKMLVGWLVGENLVLWLIVSLGCQSLESSKRMARWKRQKQPKAAAGHSKIREF